MGAITKLPQTTELGAGTTVQLACVVQRCVAPVPVLYCVDLKDLVGLRTTLTPLHKMLFDFGVLKVKQEHKKNNN